MSSTNFFRRFAFSFSPKLFAATATFTGLISLFPTSHASLDSNGQTSKSGISPTPLIALSPSEFRTFTLTKVEPITSNTSLYRFAFPDANAISGITTASCLVARFTSEDNKQIIRPYTPVSLPGERGHLDLIIKTYPAPGGEMSRHIKSLKIGESLELKGPIVKFKYEANQVDKMLMLAGGTGITPMLQIVREILGNPEDKTEICLIFGNLTEKDIILREELDALSLLYDNFKVFYTVDKVGEAQAKNWKYGKGFVTKEMIEKQFGTLQDVTKNGESVKVLVCGPKGFMNHVSGLKGDKNTQGEVGGILKDMGYTKEQVFKF